MLFSGVIASGQISSVHVCSGAVISSASIGGSSFMFADDPERIVDANGKVWRCGPSTGWQMIPWEESAPPLPK